MKLLRKLLAKTGVNHNVTYKLTDKDGNPKKLFQENFLLQLLLKLGVVSPNVPKIPFLFGRWGYSKQVGNLVTSAGKAGVASRINGAGSEAVFNYIAIGTGTTAAAAGDTALETEISSGGGSRTTGTASRTTSDVTDDTARLINTFSFTSSFAVTESGVLNAASSGVLLARQVFSAVNVANGDDLQVTWDIDVD